MVNSKENNQEFMEFDVPILFLIYNRPEVTKEVFNKIAEIKPKRLFVAADGPNKDKAGDFLKCKITRELITNNINWDCNVEFLFRDTNLGCKRAVSEGISWFFSHVERGIILEDDCLPVKSFFYYCERLLDKFEDDKRILSINGCNFGYYSEDCQFGFTKYMNMWGWATWRRSAELVDYNMQHWKNMNNVSQYGFLLNKLYYVQRPMPLDWGWILHWKERFDAVSQGEINTWDYQWIYAGLKNEMFSIFPAVNQIENLGFNSEGTHTISENNIQFPKAVEMKEIEVSGFEKIKLNENFEENFVKRKWSFHSSRPVVFHLKNYILKAIGKYE